MSSESNDKKKPESMIVYWLAIGTGAGLAIGVPLGNLAIGMAVGAGVGVAIGLAQERQRKKADVDKTTAD